MLKFSNVFTSSYGMTWVWKMMIEVYFGVNHSLERTNNLHIFRRNSCCIPLLDHLLNRKCLNRFTDDLKENMSFLANSGQIFIAYPTLVFKFIF